MAVRQTHSRQRISAASFCAALLFSGIAHAQQPASPSQLSTALPGGPSAAAASATPIAIVPIDASANVTGAFEVTSGRAVIANTGSITSTTKTTDVILPHRGTLRVCASTTVNLA